MLAMAGVFFLSIGSITPSENKQTLALKLPSSDQATSSLYPRNDIALDQISVPLI
jgi:hypothetical protein